MRKLYTNADAAAYLFNKENKWNIVEEIKAFLEENTFDSEEDRVACVADTMSTDPLKSAQRRACFAQQTGTSLRALFLCL